MNSTFKILFTAATLSLSSPANGEDFVSEATSPERLIVKKGYKVERLYSVPKNDLVQVSHFL